MRAYSRFSRIFAIRPAIRYRVNHGPYLNIYRWHKVKHIILPLTKIIRSDDLTQNAFYISLLYLF